ncbi:MULTISPECIES: hypothetical protein [Cryobacterium]|uniref:Uncharacterized protein n=1 Tax=Cryobacterium breve TaxID=1259258 RepID=A0ABY2J206_9MICO|nr:MULTISPECIES: hypothetical protein [Cryobacterium]TFC93014.1 hypothetical protein E3T20_11185 [Cryobacterium sp. TmT3-12]TFC98869.1 hypothetical protein E3O65_06950 [Cryobacterium breve]
MEDGPEFAEGSYDFARKTYRLAEVDSQVWRVYDGDTYIGIVTETDATAAEPWPHYTEHSAGDETAAAPTTHDWRAALDHLIEAAEI